MPTVKNSHNFKNLYNDKIYVMIIITPEKQFNVKTTPYLQTATVGTVVFIGANPYKVVERIEDTLTVEPWEPEDDGPEPIRNSKGDGGITHKRGKANAAMIGGEWLAAWLNLPD